MEKLIKMVIVFVFGLMSLQMAVASPKMGADRHAARGVTCQSCHGPDMSKPNYPDEKTCLACHNRAGLVKETKKLNPNPHNAPHNGDCTLCHLQHEPAEDYCAQCHKFGYKVP